MKIAVVGSGISGLSAAYYLAPKHKVVLFEQDGRVGGHTNTSIVKTPTGEQPVDTGWIVYNGLNYPNLTALFKDLKIQTRPTAMSFGVSLGEGAYEYKGSDNLLTVFAQWSNLFSPRHIRFLLDILRLNKQCNALLKSGQLPDGTLGDFLKRLDLSPWLASRYLLPMAGLIWSCSPKKAMEYPAADFMRFFESHGLFTAVSQPTWHTVVGGSHQYVRKILAGYKGELRLNTRVGAIERNEGSVFIRTGGHLSAPASGGTWPSMANDRFDAVVCATHSDQALRLLKDADPEQRTVLSGIPYNETRCILHTDESFLPKRRSAWASWNYTHKDDEIHDAPISGSYWMNLLQGIPGPVNYVVTLNPVREVPKDKIIYETIYHHPHYGPDSVMTHERLPQIQGRGGVWFAGAWASFGFHEDGLKSGLRAVRGIDATCLPGWAKL